MPWKNILLAILGVLIPFIYQSLTGDFPDFPLTVDSFGQLITWLVGLLIGGWQAAIARVKFAINRSAVVRLGDMELQESKTSIEKRFYSRN